MVTNGGTGAGQVPAASGTDANTDPKADNNADTGTETGNANAGGANGAGGANQEGEPNTYSAAYVAELRREAAKHRTAAAETATKLKSFEDAQLTEQEKKDKRYKELEEENFRLKTEGRKSGAIAEAAKLGAVVPEAIVGLIPADADNIGSAVAAIKKQFPALFKPAAPSGTADAGGGTGSNGGQAPPKGSMNAFLRAASGRPTG